MIHKTIALVFLLSLQLEILAKKTKCRNNQGVKYLAYSPATIHFSPKTKENNCGPNNSITIKTGVAIKDNFDIVFFIKGIKSPLSAWILAVFCKKNLPK